MSIATQQILDELQQAVGNRNRARILLRCPDAVMVTHGQVLGVECRRHTFEAGWEYCQIRVNVLNAVRDEHGMLPAVVIGEEIAWRMALSRFAAGGELDGLFDPAG